MTLNPMLITDYILATSRDRGELLTNLKLQKLLYYAQAWFLALYDDYLFAEDFQAWVHGPVLPTQYRRFNMFAWRPIDDLVHKPDALLVRVARHLDKIVSEFGSETAIALEIMTHREKPWRDARKGLPPHAPSTAIISKHSMRDFYKHL